jgi:hypothetical protein
MLPLRAVDENAWLRLTFDMPNGQYCNAQSRCVLAESQSCPVPEFLQAAACTE